MSVSEFLQTQHRSTQMEQLHIKQIVSRFSVIIFELNKQIHTSARTHTHTHIYITMQLQLHAYLEHQIERCPKDVYGILRSSII